MKSITTIEQAHVAIRELEDRIRRLERRASTSSGPDPDVEDLKRRMGQVEHKPNTLDFNDVFRGSGPAHALGYVPDPGPTAWDERVLGESGDWVFPFGGIIRMVTRLGMLGQQQLAGEILNILGSVAITGNLGAAKAYVAGLEVYGGNGFINLNQRAGSITPLTLRAVPGGSSVDLLRIEDSAGAVLMRVDSAGGIWVGGTQLTVP